MNEIWEGFHPYLHWQEASVLHDPCVPQEMTSGTFNNCVLLPHSRGGRIWALGKWLLEVLWSSFIGKVMLSTLQYHFLHLPSHQKLCISREAQLEWWLLKFFKPVSVKHSNCTSKSLPMQDHGPSTAKLSNATFPKQYWEWLLHTPPVGLCLHIWGLRFTCK